MIATGIPHRGRAGSHARFLNECNILMRNVAGVRRTGSACIDLAWVAAGRLDGYVDHELNPWDMAAGALLVREAGGYVTDLEGRPSTLDSECIVASNAHINKPLLEVLTEGEMAR